MPALPMPDTIDGLNLSMVLLAIALLVWIYVMISMVFETQHKSECNLNVGFGYNYTFKQDIVQDFKTGGKCLTFCKVNNTTMVWVVD